MKITADFRERGSGIVELLEEHCEIRTGSLACGDYLINGRILVERKAARDTAETLLTMGRQDLKFRDVVVLRGGYRPKRLRTRQLYFLQGLPGVGPVMAKRLLEHFGTPQTVLTSTEAELVSVKGIGNERALGIRRVLNQPFDRT